ncbi:MAG TPA: TetR/AcrR family transcriptional regulator [Gemmatimonadaceae bacterium]|nr:TetR/AcrR family transcriptional regulator [Gemmatimonadaceae bacterium]
MEPKKPAPEVPAAQAEQSLTRASLVKEATRILENEGYQSLSLRSAAKAAGLSPAAPYRHFEHGAPELLAVVAETGFRDLIAELSKTFQGQASDPTEEIFEVSLAYVRFGVERPDIYRALFSPQLAKPLEFREQLWQTGEISFSSRKTYDTLAIAKETAFQALLAPLRYAQSRGALNEGNLEEFGLALAALLHGVVGEFIDEGLGARQSQKQPWSKVRRDMARRMVELLLAGIRKPA